MDKASSLYAILVALFFAVAPETVYACASINLYRNLSGQCFVDWNDCGCNAYIFSMASWEKVDSKGIDILRHDKTFGGKCLGGEVASKPYIFRDCESMSLILFV